MHLEVFSSSHRHKNSTSCRTRHGRESVRVVLALGHIIAHNYQSYFQRFDDTRLGMSFNLVVETAPENVLTLFFSEIFDSPLLEAPTSPQSIHFLPCRLTPEWCQTRVFQRCPVMFGIRFEEVDVIQPICGCESAVPNRSRVVVQKLQQTAQVPRVHALALSHGKLENVSLPTCLVRFDNLAVKIAVSLELHTGSGHDRTCCGLSRVGIPPPILL
mmetsp:Transcript_62517/g.129867  ORF Transcript_62517/g.129867 Transcript_62517/m.129867 type:complete len:215 (-) Transcript_62517:146-790(-)